MRPQRVDHDRLVVKGVRQLLKTAVEAGRARVEVGRDLHSERPARPIRSDRV